MSIGPFTQHIPVTWGVAFEPPGPLQPLILRMSGDSSPWLASSRSLHHHSFHSDAQSSGSVPPAGAHRAGKHRHVSYASVCFVVFMPLGHEGTFIITGESLHLIFKSSLLTEKVQADECVYQWPLEQFDSYSSCLVYQITGFKIHCYKYDFNVFFVLFFQACSETSTRRCLFIDRGIRILN